MDNIFDPDLPKITETTLESFIANAKIVRQGKQLALFVAYRVSIYPIKEQKRGKLTSPPEVVLTNVYNAFNNKGVPNG